MLAIIMAGGKGTRIASVTSDIPKPMIPVCGKPVLEREIECLKDQGFKDIILTVSHMGNTIMDYFQDGSRLGVRISYYYEQEPLGNAGALFRLRKEIVDSGDDSFLLLNADAVFNIDFNRFVIAHREKNADVTLFTHPNSHPYDSGLLIASSNGDVFRWLTKEDERPQWYKNRVNAGLHVIKSRVLDEYMDLLSDTEKTEVADAGVSRNRKAIVPTGKVDLDRKLFKPLAGTGKMFVYDSPEYVKDMGTPERYYAVCKDYERGMVESKNLSKKQKAIFLDRDGTINKYVGFLKNINDFELLPYAADAVRRINTSEYLAIVVTNQPVIARGEVTFEELQMIHNKMETLLGEEGAYLDGIYFCPHHPNKGYTGEVTELKVECKCRKPEPGMLLRAAIDFNVDLSHSWMIGDGENDVLAGKKAGTLTGLVETDNEVDIGVDIRGKSLLEIVNYILKDELD